MDNIQVSLLMGSVGDMALWNHKQFFMKDFGRMIWNMEKEDWLLIISKFRVFGKMVLLLNIDDIMNNLFLIKNI